MRQAIAKSLKTNILYVRTASQGVISPVLSLRVLDMRVLFLDFDGVLHPAKSELDAERFCWLPLLEALLATHKDIAVVVHSTWRYEYRDEELRELLGKVGELVVGSAPRGPREQAIESVLQANKGRLTSYLVLDDAPDEFTQGKLNALFVDGSVGVSDPTVQEAIAAWLASSAPPS